MDQLAFYPRGLELALLSLEHFFLKLDHCRLEAAFNSSVLGHVPILRQNVNLLHDVTNPLVKKMRLNVPSNQCKSHMMTMFWLILEECIHHRIPKYECQHILVNVKWKCEKVRSFW